MLIGYYLSLRGRTLRRRRRWQWAWRKASWMSSLNRYAFKMYNVFLPTPHWSAAWHLKLEESSESLDTCTHTSAHTHTHAQSFWLERSDGSACFRLPWSLKSHSGFPCEEDSSASHSGFKEICRGNFKKENEAVFSFQNRLYSKADNHQWWSELLIQTVWKGNGVTSEACWHSHLLPWFTFEDIYNYIYSFARHLYPEMLTMEGELHLHVQLKQNSILDGVLKCSVFLHRTLLTSLCSTCSTLTFSNKTEMTSVHKNSRPFVTQTCPISTHSLFVGHQRPKTWDFCLFCACPCSALN